MKKLKKVLFKHALMYHDSMNKSTTKEEAGTYATAYLAVDEVMIEAGLHKEFWKYKTKHRGKENG